MAARSSRLRLSHRVGGARAFRRHGGAHLERVPLERVPPACDAEVLEGHRHTHWTPSPLDLTSSHDPSRLAPVERPISADPCCPPGYGPVEKAGPKGDGCPWAAAA